MSESDSPPPASMIMLISMLGTQAAAALGKIPIPGQDQPEVRLDLAKHFIDLLDILESKTQGNLDPSESQMLHGTIHQLRLMYLEQAKGNG